MSERLCLFVRIPDKGFTHGGKFHADDVFSAALLRYLNPNIVIQRGFAVQMCIRDRSISAAV